MAGLLTRRLLFLAILLSAFGWSTVSSVADTEIYDSKTRKWVKYDRATARKMFARNKQPPEAFRMQMVKFRTAAKWAGGQPGGPDNPLGARALYLYEGNQDTIYRIHGTPEPWTIGLDVSSGCIRMNNDDITDLHSRIQVGAKVIVLMQGAALYKGV